MKVGTYVEMTEGMDPRSLVAYKYFIPAEFVNVGCINFYDDGSSSSSRIYGYNPETELKTYLSGESALTYLKSCADAGVLCINDSRIIHTEIAYDADDSEKAIGMLFYDRAYVHFAPLVAGTMYSTGTSV